jgi:heat shock protein HslJ
MNRSRPTRTARLAAAAALAAGIALAGASPSSAQPKDLAGTAWRLVEIQSMDDTVARPDDRSKYTMLLNDDGAVAMRLNCNRAAGKWLAQVGPGGASGHFEFGPLAMTRAMCPPPSLDGRIAAQAAHVRSYLLKDGRLHLSLMADGGIIVWEPLLDIEFEEVAAPAIEAGILAAFPSYTRSSVGTGDAAALARYVYNRVDLNGDKQDEVLAYVAGRDFCGTGGCPLLLLARDAKGYRVINSFPVSRLPVTVSPRRTGGWTDLVRLESGGGAPASYVTHTFDGTRYVERARTPANAVPEGTRYLVGELGPRTGATLTPQTDEAAAAHRPKAPEPSKAGFATVCGVTVAGKDYRYKCTLEGVDPGASGQTVLHFPDNVVTLTWRSATSATATFEGMVPMAVTVSTTGGVTKFVFEDKVYFWVTDRRAAAEQLKTLK